MINTKNDVKQHLLMDVIISCVERKVIFFDSHCHLDDFVFDGDLEEVIDRALNTNVLAMVTVGVDEATSSRAVELASNYNEIYASIGFHPHNANFCSNEDLEGLIEKSRNPKVVAWGEIGLDYNRMYSNSEEQESCFLRQLSIADHLNLPIILHERDSNGRMIEILETDSNPDRVAVVHCFSGNIDEMRKYLDMGFYIGVTGIVSILKRGQKLRDLLAYVPYNRLLVETDAPYLIPTPHRNKLRRNEPAFVKTVLMKLAQVRGEDSSIMAKQIWNNTCDFFKIDSKCNA